MAENSIAKAYVQVIPSAKGISSKIKGIFGKEGDSAGTSFGSSLIGKVKGMIAAAGIGKALGETLTAGADLQQSLGGIETLFKDSADIVIRNAEQAYKTAGMSANRYMEMVTGFSASLLKGLGGDTEKAAAIADMALTDISDNANKMGTNMQDIQNAYQGFAKQNYTMLDNLKLGYGGTKTEMERLLADAQKLTGVKYDISNLADVYEAIHAIQEEMGITGTTALESAETFSGSLASMKAAFSDLLANLATGREIGGSLRALEETVFTFVSGNLFPMIGNIFSELPKVLESALSMEVRGLNIVSNNADTILQMGVELVTGIGTAIISAVPYLAEAAFNIVTSLGSALLETDWTSIGNDTITAIQGSLDIAAGEILGTDGNIVQSVLTAITENLPEMLNGGIEMVSSVANGLLENIPLLLETGGQLIQAILEAILVSLPEILSAGASLVGELATGLFQNGPEVFSTIEEILGQIVEEIVSHLPQLLDSGIEMVSSMADGLIDNLPLLLETGGQLMKDLLEGILDALPEILEAGVTLIGELATGLFQNGPEVFSTIGEILGEMITEIASHLPELLEQGSALVSSLISGAVACIPAIIEAAINLIDSIKNEFGKIDWAELGDNIISGIYNGITSGIETIIQAAKDVANRALSAAKRALGINSPSKVMRDEVGKFIPAGLAVGIKANTKPLTDAMHSLSDITTESLESELHISSRNSPAPQRHVYGNRQYIINIYGAEGQSMEEIAEAVKDIIQHDIEKEEESVA